jgi:RNA polymerase sigma factor (sigma-70 family)
MSALAVVTRPADQSTDDLDLVTAVRAGDDRAFELLFLRYQSRIAVYVRGMVRDHGRAEDITQEVFLAALRRMRATDREIAFKPWIYEIAKNACIDAFRRTRTTSEVSFDADEALGASDRGRLVAVGSVPETAVDTKLAIDNLCGAFGGLSQTHHDVLVMREFEGLSYVEIGERLGMSRAAVESTLFRARRRLSEEYQELVSGERCVRVRGIVDAPRGRFVGLRDQRRMARHISHCQPCRRYARLAGVELDGARAPASAASRIAALLPLPTFLRRRVEVEEAGQLLGHHGSSVLKWSPGVVNSLDPTTVSGWSKAVATVATVAIAGLGAGATVGGHKSIGGFISRAPAIVGLSPDRSAARAPAASGRSRSPSAAVARAQGLPAPNGAAAARGHEASVAAGAAAAPVLGDPAASGDRTVQGGAASPATALPGSSPAAAIREAAQLLVAAHATATPGLVAPRDDARGDRPGTSKGPVGRALGGAAGTIGTAETALPKAADDVISRVRGVMKPPSGAGQAVGTSGAGGVVAGGGGGGANGAVGAAATRGDAAAPSGDLAGSAATAIGRMLDAAIPRPR